MDVEVIVEHLKENAGMYIFGVVVLIPAIYFTRKWSLPTILYTIEIAIYCTIMHVVTHVLVLCARWFKESTSMKALREDGVPIDAPDWETPILEFWNKDAYTPEGIIWVECGLLILIFFLVWRYRPPKLKRKPGRASASKSAPGRPGSKRPGSMAKSSPRGGRRRR